MWSNMAGLEEFVEVAQCELKEAKWAFRVTDDGCNEYCSLLWIRAQGRSALETFLRRRRSPIVDPSFLVHSALDFLCHNRHLDLDVHLRTIFTVMHDHMAGFQFETSRVVERHSATFCLEASSIFTHFHGRLAALTSQLLSIKYFNSLGSGDAPPTI